MKTFTPITLTLKMVFVFLLFFSFSGWSQTEPNFVPPSDPLLTLADSLAGYGNFEESLTIFKSYKSTVIPTADKQLEIFVFLKMAEGLLAVRQVGEALEFIEKAEGLLKEVGDRYLESEGYYVRAMYFNRTGETEEAIEMVNKALLIKEEFYPGNRLALGKCYQLLGEIHLYSTGDMQKAERNLLEANKIIAQNEDYPIRAKALCCFYLSSHFRRKGKLLNALSFAQKATQIVQSMGDHQIRFLSLCYNLTANAHFYLEEYDKAIYYYNEGLKIVDARSIDAIVSIYNNMGIVYSNKNEFEKAITCYKKSLQIAGEENKFELASTYSKIGEVYLDLEIQDSAFFYLDQSLKLFEKYSPEEKFEIANVYNLLAKHFSKIKEDPTALHYFHKAITTLIQGYSKDNPLHVPVLDQVINISFIETFLSDKARFLIDANINYPEPALLQNALSLYQLIDSIYTHKSDFLEIETELHDIGHMHQIYGDAIRLLTRIYEKEKDKRYLQLALDYMERVKARILQDQLVRLKKSDQLVLPDSLLQEEKMLNAQLEDVLFNSSGPLSEKAKKESNEMLANILAKKESLKLKLAKETPAYFNYRYKTHSVFIQNIQRNLSKSNSHLLHYFWTDKAIYAMHFSKDEFAIKEIDNSADLRNNIKTYLTMLKEDEKTENYSASVKTFSHAASVIFEHLLAPFFLQELPENLIIIPDGELSDIPFEALLTEYDINKKYTFYNLTYLIRQTAVSYAYSSTTFFSDDYGKKTVQSPKILGFAYSDESTLLRPGDAHDLPELPGAVEELNNLKAIFKNDFKGYQGQQAAKDVLLENIQEYDIIHLALHAESDPGIRQNSRIYFRPVENTDSSDYILFAHDLYQYSLNNRLVVLSACETGQGKNYKGEGIYSIARGFSYAGVPTVMMTLWKLNDQSGKTIVSDFYKYLKTGKPIDIALQSAKLDYLKNADEATAHPSYWAAMISLGDRSPVVEVSNNYFNKQSIFIGAVLLLFLGAVFWYRFKLQN